VIVPEAPTTLRTIDGSVPPEQSRNGTNMPLLLLEGEELLSDSELLESLLELRLDELLGELSELLLELLDELLEDPLHKLHSPKTPSTSSTVWVTGRSVETILP